MSNAGGGHALRIERSCALVASAFSDGRRQNVRLMSGEQRCFGVSSGRSVINVPYPAPAPDWTLRTLTCGVALQCAPSKDLLAQYPLQQLTPRQLIALAIVEGEVALNWVILRWPGLLSEFRRLLPEIAPTNEQLDAPAMLDRAQTLARSSRVLNCHPVFGQLPPSAPAQRGLLASMRRLYGQMPWNSKRPLSQTLHTIPVGGQGGAKNPNLPPPSRPEDEDPEIRAHQRAGIPYPEWNAWKNAFLPDHVAVLERKLSSRAQQTQAVSADLRRWFEEHTHRAMKNRLEDGSDLDIDQYINYYVDTLTGKATEARVFRELLPASRDVATAVLLDGSSSLGAHQGRIFQLELAMACLCLAAIRDIA